MRPIKQIERQIKNIKIETNPNINEVVLNDLLTKLDNTRSNEVNNLKKYIWGRKMMNKAIKTAVAAMIVIATIIGINQLGSSGVVWADVVEQLNNYEKYKCREQVIREDGRKKPMMDVYHINLSLRRQEVEGGSIHIIDMQTKDAIIVEMYPAQKRAIITKLLGFGPKKNPNIVAMVKRFGQEPDEKLGTKNKNGKLLYGFRHRPNKHNDFTIWVDAQTKLPVEIKLTHTNRGQTIYLDEFEFDFNLPLSAFSTDVPEDYEVETIINDYRTVKPQKISPKDIQSKPNHTAYTVSKLSWMKRSLTIESIDPLGSKNTLYITGILADDGNVILVIQGNYYDTNRMTWISKQQPKLETTDGLKLYDHPNGSIYAEKLLKSFGEANPDFFDHKNLSQERFTRMVVMPEGIVVSITANKQISDERLTKIVESLAKI